MRTAPHVLAALVPLALLLAAAGCGDTNEPRTGALHRAPESGSRAVAGFRRFGHTTRRLERASTPGGSAKVDPQRILQRLLVLAYLAERFEPGREYAEREVNAILQQAHTFGDWALLRRELFDFGFVDREPDGSRYRRRERSAP